MMELKGIKYLEVEATEKDIIKQITFWDTNIDKGVLIELDENWETTRVFKDGKHKVYNRVLKKYQHIVDYVSKHLGMLRNEVAEVVNQDKDQLEDGLIYGNCNAKGEIMSVRKEGFSISNYFDTLKVRVEKEGIVYNCEFKEDSEFYHKLKSLFNKRISIEIDENGKIEKASFDFENMELEKDDKGLLTTVDYRYRCPIKSIGRRTRRIKEKFAEIIENDSVEDCSCDNVSYINSYMKNSNDFKNSVLVTKSVISENENMYIVGVGLEEYLLVTMYISKDHDLYELINNKYSALIGGSNNDN